MVGTVELVMFGIQAAIKLARTGRQIYVENSITREMTFVLPSQLDDIRVRRRGQVDPGSALRDECYH